MASYNVAKAGVVSLSETLRSELSGFGIHVTVVCPTVFVTSLGDSLKSGRAMERRLVAQLNKSRITAEHIVDDVLAAIENGRLYVMTQSDAKWGWRIKRWMPETYFSLIAYLYRNRKWLYADQA
ncbi:short chain dehydrogenase [compost metagenome]